MEYVLVYLNLILIAFAISIKFDKKIDLTIFISIAFIAIIEYFISIIISLKVANIVITLISITCFIYLLYITVKSNWKTVFNKITPGFILLTGLYIITILLYKEKMVTQHNELGCWALIVKNMNYYDSLPKLNTSMLHIGYTPITGLWHYWFSTFFNQFSDGNLYISSALLQYSLVIAITSFIKGNKFKNVLINITFITMLFTVSFLIFTSLYVDTILGLVTILGIIYILKLTEIKDKDLFIMSLIFIFTMLAKSIGILFITVLASLLLFKGVKIEKNKKYIILTVFLILIITIGFASLWSVYLKNNNLNNILGDTSKLNLENMNEFLEGNSLEYRYSTVKQYMDYLINGKNFTLFSKNVSVMFLLLIAICTMLIIYIRKKDKEILYLITIILITNILFIISLLGVYLFVFAEWEATKLSAITRYVQTINIINVCAVLYVIYEKYNHNAIIIILLIVSLFGTNRGFNEIIHNQEKIQKTIIQREKYAGIEKYRDIFNEKDKIYLVTEYKRYLNEDANREIDLLSIKYQIAPFRVYMYDKSEVTENQIINKLSCGYTYIYFYNINEEISNRYKFLIKENQCIDKNSLFKICENNGQIELDKIEI